MPHRLIVEKPERTEPIPFCFLSPQKEIVGHIQMIGQSQGLEHGFNSRFPRFNRARKRHFFAIKDNGAACALLHPGDLTNEGGFPSPIVPHDGDMFAFAQFKIRAFQSMDPAVVFGQVYRL